MKKKRRPKRKNLSSRFNLFFKPVIILCSFTIGGIFFAIFTFFNVKNIECIGEPPYEKSEIIEASNLKIGDNLVLTRTSGAAKILEEKFPYIENVSIVKKLPDKIVINTENAYHFFNVETNNENIILSKNLKVLAKSLTDINELISVRGINLVPCEIGKKAIFTNEENEQVFLELVALLENYGLIESIKFIDFTNSIIIINYDNRIEIKLGNREKMENKIRTLKELVEQKISPTEKGTLDLSMLSCGDRIYFKPTS